MGSPTVFAECDSLLEILVRPAAKVSFCTGCAMSADDAYCDRQQAAVQARLNRIRGLEVDERLCMNYCSMGTIPMEIDGVFVHVPVQMVLGTKKKDIRVLLGRIRDSDQYRDEYRN